MTTRLAGVSNLLSLLMKALLLGVIALVSLAENPHGYAAATDQAASAKLEVASSSPQQSGEVGQSAQSTNTKTESEKKKKKRSTHRGAIVVAPLPIVSPAIGSGIVPVLGYIFPFNKNDKISPPSTIGGAGLITNNGSSGFGVGAQ